MTDDDGHDEMDERERAAIGGTGAQRSNNEQASISFLFSGDSACVITHVDNPPFTQAWVLVFGRRLGFWEDDALLLPRSV